MLDGVGGRSKSRLSADGAGYVARTMDLHVHVEIILADEFRVAYYASIGRRRRLVLDGRAAIGGRVLRPGDAIPAARVAVAFPPLIAAEVAAVAPIAAVGTVSPHIDIVSQSQIPSPRQQRVSISLSVVIVADCGGVVIPIYLSTYKTV